MKNELLREEKKSLINRRLEICSFMFPPRVSSSFARLKFTSCLVKNLHERLNVLISKKLKRAWKKKKKKMEGERTKISCTLIDKKFYNSGTKNRLYIRSSRSFEFWDTMSNNVHAFLEKKILHPWNILIIIFAIIGINHCEIHYSMHVLNSI